MTKDFKNFAKEFKTPIGTSVNESKKHRVNFVLHTLTKKLLIKIDKECKLMLEECVIELSENNDEERTKVSLKNTF